MRHVYEKYSKESKGNLRPGLYSDFDGEVLYSIVRNRKPATILDFAPREGKTTSCIIKAILKNQEESAQKITYLISEKDLGYLELTKQWTKEFEDKIDFQYFGDILAVLPILKNYKLDLLFIDANHDYLLAEWYVNNLFPLVSDTGFIHTHDMFYDLNNNGLEDMSLEVSQCGHPDVISRERLIEIYGKEMCASVPINKPIKIYEEDVIREWYKSQTNYELFSTIPFAREIIGTHAARQVSDLICSLYFFPKGTMNL